VLSFLIALLLSVFIPFGMTVEETVEGSSVGVDPAPIESILKNAATATEVYAVENGSYEGATFEDLKARGLQVEPGVTLAVATTTRNRYCLEASKQGIRFHYDSRVGTPELGPCG